MVFSTSDINRFITKFDQRGDDACWPWTAGVNSERWQYGRIRIRDKLWRAPRMAWVIHFGNIPKHGVVCHKCDNPRCVNPRHLFLSTLAGNNKDRARKSRSNHKLTNAQIVAVRQATGTQRAIAKEFGICQQTVSDIKLRKYNNHV